MVLVRSGGGRLPPGGEVRCFSLKHDRGLRQTRMRIYPMRSTDQSPECYYYCVMYKRYADPLVLCRALIAHDRARATMGGGLATDGHLSHLGMIIWAINH